MAWKPIGKLLTSENEEWREVSFAPSYFVSNYGRCKHRWKNGREYQIKTVKCKCKNYYAVKIHSKEYRFAHLIWNAFRGEIPDGYRIIHIDYCIGNNDLSNLKCVPIKRHGKRTGRLSKVNRPVVSEGLGKIFFSTRSCAKKVGISYTTVASYCNNPNQENNQTLKLRWATEAEVKKYMDIIERKKLRGEYK